MNNIYFFSLLCVLVLALTPACNKQKRASQKDIKKSIEIDNTVFEIENDDNEQKVVVKF